MSDIEIKYVKALNAPDYAAFRKYKVDDPAPGTLKWFLNDDLVRCWRAENKSSVLWIEDSPGQGKTVLSKFILDHLESSLPDTEGHVKVIYYFFYDQDETLRTVSAALRSLIKQLLATADVFQHVYEMFGTDSSTESEDSLWEVLEKIFRAPIPSMIYCVLDALDECWDEGSRQRLLRRIRKLIQAPTPNARGFLVLKLLVTSRPRVEIGRELDQFPCIHLKASPRDLEIFIRSKIAALGLSANLPEIAIELLLGHAEQTFLWVSIVLKKLKTSNILLSHAELKRIIDESPTDLMELYTSIINEIMQGPEAEQKLLVWVVYARRPLKLEELEEALATQMDSETKRSADEHRIVLTEKVITSAVGIILEVSDERVHLIHQSAKDFLLKNGQLAKARFCDGLHPSTYLAKVCMTYLCFKDFEAGPCHDRAALQERKRQYPLLNYAAHHWYHHARNEDDISRISSTFCRLVVPGSPTLLAWGEVAGIPNLEKAANTWEIAVATNIAWLTDFQLSNTVVVEEERVIQAAKNGLTGYDFIRGLVKKGDPVFTEGAIHALVSNFDQGMVQLFLEKSGNIKVKHTLIKAAAANRKNGSYVMRLLLESAANLVILSDLIKVVADNGESGEDILGLLLRTEKVQLSDGALAAIVKRFGVKTIRLLPDGLGNIKITKKVVHAIYGVNWENRNEVMTILLERCQNVQATDSVVGGVAGRFDKEVITLLLEKLGRDVQITEDVVKAATRHRYSEEVMTLLLEKRGQDVQITEGVVKATAGNEHCGEKVMTLLLEKRGQDVQITEGVVKAAAGNKHCGEKAMTLLLKKRGQDIQITEDIVKAAAGNVGYGEGVMTLLFEKRDQDVQITEDVVKAVAGNVGCGVEVMTLLLEERAQDMQITEGIVKAAAGNKGCGEEVMTLLLEKQGQDVQITEDVIKAAAGNRYRGIMIMALLLEKRGQDMQIIEDIVKEAARNKHGNKLMALLLEKRGQDVQITEDVIKAAAGNGHCGEKVMTLLLEKRGQDVEITGDAVKAAAGNGHCWEKIMTLLLKKRGQDVQITEDVIKAAAGNEGCGEKVMILLLEKQDQDIQITEDVVKAAARNEYYGKEVMTLLLEQRGQDVQITEDVVKVIEDSLR
jgi:hypothetical protein